MRKVKKNPFLNSKERNAHSTAPLLGIKWETHLRQLAARVSSEMEKGKEEAPVI